MAYLRAAALHRQHHNQAPWHPESPGRLPPICWRRELALPSPFSGLRGPACRRRAGYTAQTGAIVSRGGAREWCVASEPKIQFSVLEGASLSLQRESRGESPYVSRPVTGTGTTSVGSKTRHKRPADTQVW